MKSIHYKIYYCVHTDQMKARLKYDTPLIYYNHTDYMSNNDTLQDEMWDSIDTSPLVVALDDEWATEHQLPLSVFRFPWDSEAKGIYFLKAFHGLHCLVRNF